MYRPPNQDRARDIAYCRIDTHAYYGEATADIVMFRSSVGRSKCTVQYVLTTSMSEGLCLSECIAALIAFRIQQVVFENISLTRTGNQNHYSSAAVVGTVNLPSAVLSSSLMAGSISPLAASARLAKDEVKLSAENRGKRREHPILLPVCDLYLAIEKQQNTNGGWSERIPGSQQRTLHVDCSRTV